MDTHDYVTQLTRPHKLTERVTVQHGTTTITQPHSIRVPSLIDQLNNTEPAVGSNGIQGAFGSAYASEPTANLEAIDTLTRIDIQAATWIKDLGEDDPATTTACVRLLASLLPSCTDVQRKAIEADIRRWWTRARITTGHDQPPMRPNNTCPLCGTRGTLRIRILDTAAATAYCINCEETWTPDHIGLLAEHIRLENGEELAS